MPPTLSHVVLASRDLAATEAVLATLGLPRHEIAAPDGNGVAAYPVGDTVLVVAPLGHAAIDGRDKPGVDHIAFRAADPAADGAALAQLGIETIGEVTAGFENLPQIALASASLAGVRTRLSVPLALPASSAGPIERIDHIGIASADNAAAVHAFCGRLGLRLESQQTDMEVAMAVESFTSDKYGVVYHTRAPVPVGGLRVSFITAGDCELEFLQNFDSNQDASLERGAAGNTRQDQGAITRFVATRGPGLHHIAFKATDIDATLAALRQAGIALIDGVGRPGSRRARIGFLHPSGAGSILFHLVQRA